MTKNEKPYYYSNTVENGKIVEHEGDEKHAVYLSEMKESTKRANRWHKWVEKNVPNAYNGWGIMDEDVYAKYNNILKEFMSGARIK